MIVRADQQIVRSWPTAVRPIVTTTLAREVMSGTRAMRRPSTIARMAPMREQRQSLRATSTMTARRMLTSAMMEKTKPRAPQRARGRCQ